MKCYSLFWWSHKDRRFECGMTFGRQRFSEKLHRIPPVDRDHNSYGQWLSVLNGKVDGRDQSGKKETKQGWKRWRKRTSIPAPRTRDRLMMS